MMESTETTTSSDLDATRATEQPSGPAVTGSGSTDPAETEKGETVDAAPPVSDEVLSKAARYAKNGRVRIIGISADGDISADVRGDGATYRVVWDHAGSVCMCPAKGRCAHIIALETVHEGPSGQTPGEDSAAIAEVITEKPSEMTEVEKIEARSLVPLAAIDVTDQTLRRIADTEFVPTALRGRPAAILAAVLYGRELGLGPMESLTSIDIIDGRPSPSAQMLTRLIRANGHRLEIVKIDDVGATVKGTRADTGETLEVTFTIEDAARVTTKERGSTISLAETKRWREYPGDMCYNRAATRLYRRLFSDVTELPARCAPGNNEGSTDG